MHICPRKLDAENANRTRVLDITNIVFNIAVVKPRFTKYSYSVYIM